MRKVNIAKSLTHLSKFPYCITKDRELRDHEVQQFSNFSTALELVSLNKTGKTPAVKSSKIIILIPIKQQKEEL